MIKRKRLQKRGHLILQGNLFSLFLLFFISVRMRTTIVSPKKLTQNPRIQKRCSAKWNGHEKRWCIHVFHLWLLQSFRGFQLAYHFNIMHRQVFCGLIGNSLKVKRILYEHASQITINISSCFLFLCTGREAQETCWAAWHRCMEVNRELFPSK